MTNHIEDNTIIIEKLRKSFTSDLETELMNEALNDDYDFKLYLQDITANGCASGAVAHLIYYNETEAFHDKYEDEIDELVDIAVTSSGLSFSEIASSIDIWDVQQLKNWKAWFAYETVADMVLNKYEEFESELEA